jgi:hypothetical protein
MPLLQAYTVGFVDEYCKKIMIYFVDNKPSEYERNQFVKYFKKHKKETFIDRAGEQINYVVVKWEYWVGFLIKLGFRATAEAVCDILNDLEKDKEIDSVKYLEQIARAKSVDLTKEKNVVDEKYTEREWERKKRKELAKLMQKDEN